MKVAARLPPTRAVLSVMSAPADFTLVYARSGGPAQHTHVALFQTIGQFLSLLVADGLATQDSVFEATGPRTAEAAPAEVIGTRLLPELPFGAYPTLFRANATSYIVMHEEPESSFTWRHIITSNLRKAMRLTLDISPGGERYRFGVPRYGTDCVYFRLATGSLVLAERGALAAALEDARRGKDHALTIGMPPADAARLRAELNQTSVGSQAVLSAPQLAVTAVLEMRDLMDAVALSDVEYLRGVRYRDTRLDNADEFGQTALVLAVTRGDATLVQGLLRAGASPTAGTGLTDGPLIEALLNWRADIASVLLRAGADTTAVSRDGAVALTVARRVGGVALMSLLLAHGADVNRGARPDWTPLIEAITERDEAGASFLALVSDINRPVVHNGITALPIHFAAAAGLVATTAIMAGRMPSVDVATSDGHTPLELAGTNPAVRAVLDQAAAASGPAVAQAPARSRQRPAAPPVVVSSEHEPSPPASPESLDMLMESMWEADALAGSASSQPSLSFLAADRSVDLPAGFATAPATPSEESPRADTPAGSPNLPTGWAAEDFDAPAVSSPRGVDSPFTQFAQHGSEHIPSSPGAFGGGMEGVLDFY